MKTKQILVLLTGLFIIHIQAIAQKEDAKVPPILFKGKISFERKNNTHKQLDDMMKSRGGGENAWVENIKKQSPKYKIDQFELFFTETQSVYKPAPNGITETKMMMGTLPAEKNIVFNDYKTKKTITEKKIFDKTFLINDSLKKMNWKITEDFRKIAGFNCRRAEAIVMDSIYVIAFYTDAILATGGPESFNGLPGMILGIVVPRLNITYFATKVDNFLADEKEILAPIKGTKSTHESILTEVKEGMKQWGKMAERFLWYAYL